MEKERNAYVVKLEGGNMTIVKALTRAKAEQWGRLMYGSYMYVGLKEATEDDIDWVILMGGMIHEA